MNDVQQKVVRRSVRTTFSKDFEKLLLSYPSDHTSLTLDLEFHVQRGLTLLEELEDVHDLNHTEVIRRLIAVTNENLVMKTEYFKYWHIAISENLLDEIDLIGLVHGDDLKDLGLSVLNQGSILILVATASFELNEPLLPASETVTHFSDKFKATLSSRNSDKPSGSS